MYLGVDVSNNNGHIDWQTVADAAVDRAIVKASEGTDFHDGFFHYNITRAVEVGLHVAPYHFGRPSRNTGANEARYFAAICQQYKIAPAYVLDLEDDRVAPRADLAAYALDFFETFQAITSRRLHLYTSHGYAAAHNLTFQAELGAFELYIAAWQSLEPSSFDPFLEWAGWQFTAEGFTPGVGLVTQSLWRHPWP